MQRRGMVKVSVMAQSGQDLVDQLLSRQRAKIRLPQDRPGHETVSAGDCEKELTPYECLYVAEICNEILEIHQQAG